MRLLAFGRSAALAAALPAAGCGADDAPPLTERAEFQIQGRRYAMALPAGAAIRSTAQGVEIETTPGRRASPLLSLTAPTPDPPVFDRSRDLGGEKRIAYRLTTAEAGSGGTAAVLEGRLEIGENAYAVSCYIQGDDVRLDSGEWCLPMLRRMAPSP